ncbi:hypothetical protein CHLRE_02g081050v5 [Chlamydomonas reinhardtii]|uniref:Flagellar associated protein n=1 Tax=Chlamydomonas reinhardtii TaxID=3055 RepID=A0A2K3E0J7_CHLRE|nr:uncharacterized protein CHLRE_02g081050v5 [Chlamydomonas reinhardtii]PNW86303.1 hypothetical protein CHLRE_02g081050v5 [Chlamydomonas reinhardtii]
MASRGLFAALCAACLAVASAAPLRNSADCVNVDLLKVTGVNVFPTTRQISSSSVQFLQDRTTVSVAQNFEVSYYSTFKVVTNLYTFAKETYVLYQCGTAAPNPADYGLPAATKVLAVPLTAVSVQDTTVLNFMKILNVLDRVAYVTPYAVEPCMQALAGGSCNRTSDNAVADKIDGKFVGFSVKPSDPQAITFTATADPGPLNRAEYIKYVATFFNREAAANTAFNAIVSAYNANKQLAATYLSKNSAVSPLVAWIYYQPKYDSATYKAPEQVVLYFNAYRRQYVQDAGGRLHDLAALNAQYGNNNTITVSGSQLVFTDLPNTLPVLRTILASVDVVIDESFYDGKNPTQITLDDFRALYGLTDAAALTDLKFLANQRLLRLDGSANPGGTTAWFEEAVARPDIVLHDLVSAFLPNALLSIGDTVPAKLVRNMFASNPGRVVLSSAAQCPAAQATCGAPASPVCPAVYLDCQGRLTAATDSQPCAPSCSASPSNNAPNGAGGAASRAAAQPLLLVALLVAALAVLGWGL